MSLFLGSFKLGPGGQYEFRVCTQVYGGLPCNGHGLTEFRVSPVDGPPRGTRVVSPRPLPSWAPEERGGEGRDAGSGPARSTTFSVSPHVTTIHCLEHTSEGRYVNSRLRGATPLTRSGRETRHTLSYDSDTLAYPEPQDDRNLYKDSNPTR